MKLGKFILPFMLLVSVLLGAGVCSAAECPVEVKVVPLTTSPLSFCVEITSITDTVTIQNIQANRGNVKFPASRIDGKEQFPKTLKFGEQGIFIPEPNKIVIRELVVQTNLGTWTFTIK
jgi:hypothetical protein